MEGAPARPRLTYDLDVDVCVVGGGFAGLTAAREIARRGWSVALVEAGRIGSGASGCSAGVVAPGFSEPIEAIVERVGLKRAKELWALSAAGVDYVRNAIAEIGMAGVDRVDGQLLVRTLDDEDALLRTVAMLRVDFGADVEAWPTAQVRESLLSPHYFQAIHNAAAFHIHPLNYVLGLAAAAEQAGVRVFEATAATALDANGVRKRVETPEGRVRAGHIVLAGGINIGAVYPVLAETVVPVFSYIGATAPLGEQLSEAVRYTGAVSDSRAANDAYRIVGGDRLMWGGRIGARNASPRRVEKLISRDIRRIYPQFERVEIAHAWSGVTSYAVHKMPQIGELDRGVWLAGAFGMHGINTSAMAGQLIADAIVDGDDRWRLFSDYELVWAGGRLGRAATQAIVWSLPLRDAAAVGLAELRHAVRRRSAQRAVQKATAALRRKTQERDRRAAQQSTRVAAQEAARQNAEATRQAVEEAAQRATADAVRRAAEQAGFRADTMARRATEQSAIPMDGMSSAGARLDGAEDAARREAEIVAQRLADALREADQLSRREGAVEEAGTAGEIRSVPRVVP
jgi:glycine/D-amino acid oxidase-like deaminating enzyme